MELTRTDAVFSRTTMVLFMCRSKRSRNDLKLHGATFLKIRKIPAKDEVQGAHHLAMRVGGMPAPLGRTPYLVGPLLPLRLQLHLYILSFREKKIREKKSPRFTIRSRCQALKPLGRLIWSPFGAPERGIHRHRHHQPSSITNFMMLTTVRE